MSESLPPRQREVFDLLIRGYTQREICAKMTIALGTLRNHIYLIYRKMNVPNRVTLILKHYGLPSWMDEE